MSAAGSLLRRRSWRVLTSVLKHRQREIDYPTATSRGSSHARRSFTTGENVSSTLFPRAVVQDRQFRGTNHGAYRKFATDADSCPTPPVTHSTDSALGTGTKVAAVAVTVAALAWATAYLAFDVKPEQVSKYFSQLSKEGRGKENQASPESHITTGHQSNGENSEGPPNEAKFEVPDVDPKGHERPDSVLQVKDEVGQSYLGDTVTEVREEIGESVSSAYWIDPTPAVKEEVTPRAAVTKVKEGVESSLPSAFMIDPVTEVKEEGGRPHDTVTEVNEGTKGSEGQPGFPTDTDGKRLPNTNLEDLEPDTFRKQMQETVGGDELKELSDKILYNQTRDERDGDQAVSSPDSGVGLPNIVTETIEAVSDLAEAIQKAGLDALRPDDAGVQEIPGIAEAYNLTEADNKQVEDSSADEYGSDEFFKYAGAIEEATRRQAEADAQFREMLLKLDEEYQQDLKEARKKQEEQAEYAKKLKKDLSVEKSRWEEQTRQQLDAAEERLRNELKRKEEDAKRELQKMELLTKAQTNAAVAAEKARQLEDTKELQIQVEALHRAYNARTEGAKVSHTTHKLAMGAFAFEEAMTRGAPLEEEVELLQQAAGGNDELIDVALRSLPEDVLTEGTKTQIQLQREFEILRSPLRQLALIPAGQGGLLTHAMATAVAAMKVREGTGREGVESVIATVEECLANGELFRAAATLEQGVKGSRAEPFVSDWTRHVRARVIAEQALTLIQAHAIATAAGLA